MARIPIEQRLAAIETGLNAPTTIPEIGTLLAPFGYDSARIAEGQQMLAEAQSLVQQQRVEYGEQYEATEAVQQTWDAAKAVYAPTVAIGRVALKKEAAVDTALGLKGRRKRTLSGWIDQANTFYTNLLANAAWVTEMAKFNRPQPTLEAEQALVQALVAANLDQEKEKGEAQAKTRERDAKLEELYDWYSDYREIAEVALAGHPEWIELVRGGEVE